ncbi:MAG: hypothetical protein Q9162_006808 [Coniocarpon cinnabarinum]
MSGHHQHPRQRLPIAPRQRSQHPPLVTAAIAGGSWAYDKYKTRKQQRALASSSSNPFPTEDEARFNAYTGADAHEYRDAPDANAMPYGNRDEKATMPDEFRGEDVDAPPAYDEVVGSARNHTSRDVAGSSSEPFPPPIPNRSPRRSDQERREKQDHPFESSAPVLPKLERRASSASSVSSTSSASSLADLENLQSTSTTEPTTSKTASKANASAFPPLNKKAYKRNRRITRRALKRAETYPEAEGAVFWGLCRFYGVDGRQDGINEKGTRSDAEAEFARRDIDKTAAVVIWAWARKCCKARVSVEDLRSMRNMEGVCGIIAARSRKVRIVR